MTLISKKHCNFDTMRIKVVSMLCDVPLSISSDVYKMLEHACSEYQFSPSTFAICTSRTATLLWAEQGAAAAIVVGTGLIPYDGHDLCFRPLSGGLLQNYHRMLVTLQNRSLSSVTQNFIHYCRINAIPSDCLNPFQVPENARRNSSLRFLAHHRI